MLQDLGRRRGVWILDREQSVAREHEVTAGRRNTAVRREGRQRDRGPAVLAHAVDPARGPVDVRRVDGEGVGRLLATGRKRDRRPAAGRDDADRPVQVGPVDAAVRRRDALWVDRRRERRDGTAAHGHGHDGPRDRRGVRALAALHAPVHVRPIRGEGHGRPVREGDRRSSASRCPHHEPLRRSLPARDPVDVHVVHRERPAREIHPARDRQTLDRRLSRVAAGAAVRARGLVASVHAATRVLTPAPVVARAGVRPRPRIARAPAIGPRRVVRRRSTTAHEQEGERTRNGNALQPSDWAASHASSYHRTARKLAGLPAVRAPGRLRRWASTRRHGSRIGRRGSSVRALPLSGWPRERPSPGRRRPRRAGASRAARLSE